MAAPVVYGPSYSTYTRTARLALEEKGVDYKLEEVDILQGAAQSAAHTARHPFAKVPAFEHDGFSLYETGAVTRYVDEAFPGAKLQPADAKRRARMMQIISVINSYGYIPMIWHVFVQRAVQPMMGGEADEKVIAEAMPKAEKAVAALEALADGTRPVPVRAGAQPRRPASGSRLRLFLDDAGGAEGAREGAQAGALVAVDQQAAERGQDAAAARLSTAFRGRRLRGASAIAGRAATVPCAACRSSRNACSAGVRSTPLRVIDSNSDS